MALLPSGVLLEVIRARAWPWELRLKQRQAECRARAGGKEPTKRRQPVQGQHRELHVDVSRTGSEPEEEVTRQKLRVK